MEEKGECHLEGRGCSDGETVTGEGGRGPSGGSLGRGWRHPLLEGVVEMEGGGSFARYLGKGASRGPRARVCLTQGSGYGVSLAGVRQITKVPVKAVTKNLANSTV